MPAASETTQPPQAPAAVSATPSPVPASPTPSSTPPAPTFTPAPTPTSDWLAAAPQLNSNNAGKLEVLKRVDYGPWNLITALAWSPDGRWLAVGVGEDIYLLALPNLQKFWSCHVGSLTHGLAFSPDSLWLGAASRDGYFRAFKTAALTGSPPPSPDLEIQAHRKGANAVAFSPLGAASGGYLAASGGNDGIARFWDMASNENTGQMIGGTFAIPSIAFLPDGSLLAVINGDRIRLREVGSERIAGTFASDVPLYSLAVSPDGTMIAAGGSDNQVRVWPVASAYRTGQEQYPDAQIFAGHQGAENTFRSLVWQVAFNPRGDLLASAGGDGALVVWAFPGAQPLAVLPAHAGGATSVVFEPDGRLLATGGLDGSLLIWGVRGD